MSAIPELAEHLKKKHGFVYILPGKFTSDPVEGRFGWYRQMNGGNYFMSLKQLMQSEKKIRVLSLMQQHALLSGSCLKEFDALPLLETSFDIGAEENDVLWLNDVFARVSLDDITCADANITYYVSGYVGRSISRRRKCSSCKELLIAGDDSFSIHHYLPDEYKQLFENVNRGGLSQPSEFIYTVTALAVQHYMAILSTGEPTKTKFLSMSNPRSVFLKALINIAAATETLSNLLSQQCSAGHLNFKEVVKSTFNCFAKNELKRINAFKVEMPEISVKKLRKLTSKSSQF